MISILPQLRTLKTALTMAAVIAVLIPAWSSVNAQSAATVTCIPVQQLSQNKTQIECRMSTDEVPYFLVSEVGFPFNVTRLVKVSSTYSAAVGLQYPTDVVDDTVFISSVSWGDSQIDPSLQAIPFDSLSIIVETDQPMKTVKLALEAGDITVDLLSPNPADALDPFFQSLDMEEVFQFDNSLFMEGVTQYESLGVLQFLRLGLQCYQVSAQACLSNIIQNL